jgi:Na+(H+)/acetate symporter ActP
MVGGLIAANSSTILTHLNWGSSYLVHDFYRRFVRRDATERHYVNAGRVCTIVLYIVAGFLGLMLESAQAAFQIIISIGAGTGLLYLLRWFWWRINAWCEVVAMISSFAISIVFFVLAKSGHGLPFAQTILISVGFTTVCWLIAAFASPPTNQETLIAFYRKVHPSGPGWASVRAAAGVTEAGAALHGDHMGMAALGWISGCVVIWSSLFAIGNFLYARTSLAWGLTGIFFVSGITLVWVINNLWDRAPDG